MMKRRSFLQVGAGMAAATTTMHAIPPAPEAPSLRRREPKPTVSGSISAADLTPYQPRPDKPWDARRAAHLLRRAGFGVRSADIDAALLSTPSALVTAMLAPQALPPAPAAWTSQAPFPSLDNAAVTSYTNWVRELQEWWFGLMMQQGSMLREKMVLFWHNHFVSEFLAVYVTQYLYMQNQLFREFAFGDFRELTKRVTIDPAMLIYLDGYVSRAGNPNENYARELLELFTLGAGAYTNGTLHYTEHDIVELSRALTGWTVTGLTSEFRPARFDSGSKSIFGSTANYGIAGKTPSDVIDLIFEQQDLDNGRRRAATYLCSKLYQTFVYHIPDEAIVSEMARTLESNGWRVGPVLQQLLTSEHFFDDNVIGALIKSPTEFTVGAMRSFALTPKMSRGATNLSSPESHDPITTMSYLSQRLFYPPNVKGWVGGRDWISSATVPLRIRYAKFWVEPIGSSLAYGFDPVAFVKSFPDSDDVHKVLDRLIDLLLPIDTSDETRTLLLNDLLAGGFDYEWNPDSPNAVPRIRACLIRLVSLGEYQLM